MVVTHPAVGVCALLLAMLSSPALSAPAAPPATKSGTEDLGSKCYGTDLEQAGGNCGVKSQALQASLDLPMRVGAGDLSETAQAIFRGRPKLRFAEALDRCQAYAHDHFDCTVIVNHAAALAYRDKGFGAELVTDSGTTITITSLIGAFIENGQSASALRWTSIVGVVPIVWDDALQMRPRERLYLISATALTDLTFRYQQLDSLVTQAGDRSDLVKAEKPNLCSDIEQFKTEVSKSLNSSDQLVVSPELKDLVTRCAAIVAADATIQNNFTALTALKTDRLAGTLALDAKSLDDQVGLLDRELRSTPTQAFREALGAPFNLVGKILSGTAQPSALSDTAAALFAKPFTLPLTATPVLAAPSTLPALPLAMQDEVGSLVANTHKTLVNAKAAKASKTKNATIAMDLAEDNAAIDFQTKATANLAALNNWLAALNTANAAFTQIQALTAKSVLTIDFTANNQPVTFAKPAGAS